MTDKKKFEKMLELLIAEDRNGAEELFHEIVVEQSRTIYESILEDDLNDDEVEESSEEDEDEVEEGSEEEVDEDDKDLDEGFNLDEFEVEADPADSMMNDVAFGNEPEDDMNKDTDDKFGDEEDEEEAAPEERLDDLEDALEDLKAEFQAMMGGDEVDGDEVEVDGDEVDGVDGDEVDFTAQSDDDDDDNDDADEGYGYSENFAFEDETNESVTNKSETEQMREYVEKISKGGGLEAATDLKTEAPGANSKSIVASKNDMGGSAANIAKGGTESGTVEANKGNIKGAAINDQNKKEDSHGNVNVPGGKAAKSLKANPKGHGTEKKGAAETAPNKKSIIGSKK